MSFAAPDVALVFPPLAPPCQVSWASGGLPRFATVISSACGEEALRPWRLHIPRSAVGFGLVCMVP